MKRHVFCFVLFFTSFSASLFAQDWVKMMNDPKVNVHDVQAAFNTWYEQHKNDKDKAADLIEGNEAEEQGTELYRRWEAFMVPRTGPSGERPDGVALAKQYRAYIDSVKSSQSSQRTLGLNTWAYAGTTSAPLNGGDGRVNRVRFYPGNTNIIYACSPSGGLWKTTNGGASWSTNTDNLQELGTADIAINPLKPSIMYLATGDNDGLNSGETPGTVGLLRSANGGNTWNTTGLTYSLSTSTATQISLNQVVFNPQDTGILYAATAAGLYYSVNDGATWTQAINDNIKDVEFEPSHGAKVYAVSFSGSYYHSTDWGHSFTKITTGLPTSGVGRMAIGVTAKDSTVVYVLAVNSSTTGFYGIYESTDKGITFTAKAQLSTGSPNLLGWSSSGSDVSGQAWYNLAIMVSPTYSDSVFVAGSYLWISADGGSTWTFDNNMENEVHVDIHCLTLYPGSSSSFLMSTDGGVAITTDAGNSWTDISNNLAIGEQYSIGLSSDNPNLYITGWQDDNTDISGSPWQSVFPGDGMECFIDYTNDENMFASTEYGHLGSSFDGGISWQPADFGIYEQGPWVTRWMQDPQNPSNLFAGFVNVWESNDQGNSWSPISTWGAGYQINALAVAPSYDSCIYAAAYLKIYGTNNGGNTWSNITSNLPVGSAYISSIVVNPYNSSQLWVTFSGWNSLYKVYYSANGGTSWTNMSTGLPNLPVNCMVYQPGTAGLYVGTDIGVYYKDNTTGGWIAYNNGLPNVEITELKLYKDNTLVASTYGRGTWKVPTYTNVNTGIDPVAFTSSVKVYPNPTSGNLQVAFDGQNGEYEINIVNVLGQVMYSNSVSIQGHYADNINLSGYGKGVYIVSINGSNTKVQKKVVVY